MTSLLNWFTSSINSTNNDDEKLNYTYKLGKGISKVKGGINVFRDLDYPTAIVNIMKKEINNAL